MKSSKGILGRLGPNSLVDLRVEKSDDLDEKDDLRTTRILEVTESFIVVEQPTPKVHRKRVGSIMGVTYIRRDKHGNLVRDVLEAELKKVADFKLQSGFTEALFFDYPFNIYSASVRRHYRVEIPPDEDAFVAITDIAGHPIGSQSRYRIMDLSLQGLQFLCIKKTKTTGGLTTDPVSRLSKNDEILTKVYVKEEELLWTKSIIRKSVAPRAREGNVLYFGLEFLQRVTRDDQSKKLQFHKYGEQERRSIMPYISNLQRKACRKERGV